MTKRIPMTMSNAMRSYLKESLDCSGWENPKMENIMRSIQECNSICYTSYRAAVKLRVLSKELCVQHVQLDLIAGVFERHKLSITENSIHLDPSEIEDVLSDIYFAANKEGNLEFDIDALTKLATCFILNTFDKQRSGNILVFSVKVALVLMCSGKLQEKYGYLYQQLADHNACLSKAGLQTLLTNICKIAEMLGEQAVYNCCHIPSHVESCFAKSQGCLGVTESEFATWIMKEPLLLIWITAFNRIKSAEHVTHNVRCSSCKVMPMQGLRYSCLKCTSYNQCQECFLLGKTSNKHKLKHPIREYCTKTSHREATKLIIELIRNKLRLCPTKAIVNNMEDLPAEITCDIDKTADSMSVRSTIKKRILSDPQKELQSIITHLEEENKQLQIELLDIQDSRAERLQRHRATIESQLQRLKILKKYLFTEMQTGAQLINRMESTPMPRSLKSRVTRLPLEFELSPIIHQSISEQRTTKVDDKTKVLVLNNTDTALSNEEASTSSGFGNASGSTHIELSTWIGGKSKTELSPRDSGFSQWLCSADSNCKEEKYGKKRISNTHNDSPLTLSNSPTGTNRDNTPSSLQRPDKHSQHSSLQNIQGDLNDILDRLQNMVANDCLLEESYVANDNCKLKRATTEMEDLLTGLIEGMESRKSKLTTIV